MNLKFPVMLFVIVATALSLTACGGGGGSSDDGATTAVWDSSSWDDRDTVWGP